MPGGRVVESMRMILSLREKPSWGGSSRDRKGYAIRLHSREAAIGGGTFVKKSCMGDLTIKEGTGG